MNEQPKWYRDPVWQTVGTFIGLAALAFSVWFFWLGRETKALTVTILAETPLVSIASAAGGLSDLTVLYKGEPATNVVLVQVKVENTGNVPIRPEDFITPLRYVFAETATVVDAGVVESVPANLGMTVAWEGNVATIPPLLLNEGDRAILRFVLVYGTSTGAEAAPNESLGNESFVVDTRIAGVNQIKVVNSLAEGPVAWVDLIIKIILTIFVIFTGLLLFFGYPQTPFLLKNKAP